MYAITQCLIAKCYCKFRALASQRVILETFFVRVYGWSAISNRQVTVITKQCVATTRNCYSAPMVSLAERQWQVHSSLVSLQIVSVCEWPATNFAPGMQILMTWTYMSIEGRLISKSPSTFSTGCLGKENNTLLQYECSWIVSLVIWRDSCVLFCSNGFTSHSVCCLEPHWSRNSHPNK